jgi:hypothetical protein
MRLPLFLLAIAVVYFLTRTEGFQDDAGDFIEQKAQISPDRNESMIQLTQARIKEQLKLCTYCIETNKIQMFKNSKTGDIKYKARYMFLVFAGFPYGIAVDVEILNDKVVSFATQPTDVPSGASDSIVAFTDEVAHEFVAYDQLAQKPSLTTTVK